MFWKVFDTTKGLTGIEPIQLNHYPLLFPHPRLTIYLQAAATAEYIGREDVICRDTLFHQAEYLVLVGKITQWKFSSITELCISTTEYLNLNTKVFWVLLH